jgi:hypothetical protein
MIVLKPKGGLCNRLRAIDSGLLLSQKINKPLKVLWTLSSELNCRYHTLFETSEMLTVVDVRAGKLASIRLLNKLFFILDYGLARMKYQHVIFQSQMNRLRDRNYDFTQLSSYRSVYIESLSRFYVIDRKYQPFQPTKFIQSIVDTCTASYSSHTVGVHIRRTDHHISKAASSEEDFMHAMDQEIQRHPEVKFFLASDSPQVMSRFIKQYGDRVIWHPKEYTRNTPKGIQDALVDLLCLSKTTKILGSYGSSFSETAVKINDIPLCVIGNSQ